MEEAGELRQICNKDQLQDHLQSWASDATSSPIGYILSLEGADSIRDLDDLHRSYEQGLRALGPAHYGVGRYAHGHDTDGRLSTLGRGLLNEMDSLSIILDVTHLCERTFWDALDVFQGPVWASHHNCRALVDDPRQLSDDQIKAVAERGGVIGVSFDVWMVAPGWDRGIAKHPDVPNANLSKLADHVDHVCQPLGTSQHTGIGSDLDGGFGNEQTPSDLDTIADLSKFTEILQQRGYSDEHLQGICHGNFIGFLKRVWSQD
jgi:membrane dipeptidase